MLNHGQVLQYFCSKCNSSLTPAAEVDVARITEACPCCGYSLAETLQTRRPVREKLAAPQLQTVHDVSVLTFDIKPLDDFFLGFRAGDALCITGPAGNLLACRLCVRAMLSKKRGGLESPVLFIDAGNNSDVYQCVDFARQYGLDVAKVLNGIMVSRAFTVYQLAGLLIHELHSAVRQLGAKLVVISGLLAMFTQDPQVDQAEARQLLREMLSAVGKVADKVTVVVTADSLQGYEDIVKFDSRLEAADPARIFASTSSRSKVIALPPKALKAGQSLRYVITDYKRRRTVPVELIDEKTSVDAERYVKLLAEVCDSLISPFGYRIASDAPKTSSLCRDNIQ